MIEWHSINEKPTNEKAQYLLIVKVGQKRKIYDLARYSKDLHKLSKYDFKKGEGGGFWYSDSEWGYVRVSDVLMWSELSEIPDCFESIE